MAKCCGIKDTSHYLYAEAYAMCAGKWFPDESRLRIFEDALLRCLVLAEWAFLETGHELETLRTDLHVLPSWIRLTDPRAAQQICHPPVMPSPPVKPYPGSTGAAMQAQLEALHREAAAEEFRAAKAAALQ